MIDIYARSADDDEKDCAFALSEPYTGQITYIITGVLYNDKWITYHQNKCHMAKMNNILYC